MNKVHFNKVLSFKLIVYDGEINRVLQYYGKDKISRAIARNFRSSLLIVIYIYSVFTGRFKFLYILTLYQYRVSSPGTTVLNHITNSLFMYFEETEILMNYFNNNCNKLLYRLWYIFK